MRDGTEQDDDVEALSPFGGESDSVYEAIFRVMEDAVFLIDVSRTDGDYGFTFRRNNSAHRERTGLTEDELRGQSPRELLGDEQGSTVASNYRRCAERRETIQYEETLDLPGSTSHWQTKLTPIVEDDRVIQIVGVARDVTARADRERQIERLNRRFETVLETMSAAVFLKDTDGEYLLMNQACRDLFGVEEDEEIVGATDEDFFPRDVAERATADDRRVLENDETTEIEETVPTSAGTTVRLTRKSPVYDDRGEVTALCGVSTEITERKRREEELERLKERFQLAVEGASLGVWDWDMTTDAVEFNEQWATMLGHPLDDLESRLEEWEQRVHPDDIEGVREALEEHIAGETSRYDTEHRMRTADGDWTWVRTVGEVAERTEDGDPIRAVGIHLDIEERKEYEKALERQRDSLDVLNQVVRHDVRNALQLVLAHADMLEDDGPEDGEPHRRQIVEAGREAVDITRTAGDVTKVLLRSDTVTSPVSLRSVLEGQVEDVRARYEGAIVSVDGQLPAVDVRADEMLRSVVRNLLTNAIVHNDEPIPEVTVSVTTADETVRVRVADNGPGIPDDLKDRIFEEGKKDLDSGGTGLGLYLVRTLVDRYGGEVWVEDGESDGTAFVVELVRGS